MDKALTCALIIVSILLLICCMVSRKSEEYTDNDTNLELSRNFNNTMLNATTILNRSYNNPTRTKSDPTIRQGLKNVGDNLVRFIKENREKEEK